MIETNQIEAFIDELVTHQQTYLDLAEAIHKHTSVDLVHDFRVTTRRLLMIESLLRPYVETRAWRKPCKQLLKQLNRLRDLQVLCERFQDNQLFHRRLKDDLDQEEKNRPDFLKLLHENLPQDKLLISFDSYIQYVRKHHEALPVMLGERWQVIYHDMNGYLSAVEHEGLYWLHKLRVSYKSLRYFTELLTGSGLVDNIESDDLKYWQDVLGEIQDINIAIYWLEKCDSTQALRDELSYSAQLMSSDFWKKKNRLSDLIKQIDIGMKAIVGPG